MVQARSLVIACLLCVLPAAAKADPFLGRLDCVSIEAYYLDVGESFGITTQELRNAIQSGLIAQAPDLKVEPGCPDRVAYKVYLQNIATDTFHGFFGHVALEVTRKAIFRDTALLTAVRAWNIESYLSGTRDKAKAGVFEQLTRHLTQLAADYRAANKYR
ncbi:MAG: hypothetical protein AB1411_02840 [Nitrospirota bacterium]